MARAPTSPRQALQLDHDALVDAAPRVVRVAADERLARVRETYEALQAGDKSDALHDFRVAVRRLRSWIRDFEGAVSDTLARKHTRRLGRIATATRESRDLEVHIEWVEKFGHAGRKKHRAGIDWLLARLHARKARADIELHRVLDVDFARATQAIGKALRRYTVKVDQQAIPFARAAAGMVRARGAAARDALSHIKGIGDRVEGHEARIAVKRLRYLLEPLSDCIDSVPALVAQLSELQDSLGALHDAQLFGSEIARALAKVLASKKGKKKIAATADVETADDGRDRAAGVLAISRRLRRDEEAAFSHVQSSWLEGGGERIWSDISAVADALDALAKEGREIERKYLLHGLPDDTPPGEILEIDQGYLPGERLVERVRRVRAADRTTYFRTVKVGRGLERSELEEEATERVFKALWPLTKGRRVQKRRHRIEFDGRRWEIDEFLDRELVLAEVELDSADDTVAIPEWLESVLDHDVTDDDAYTNSSLAQ